MRFLYLSRNMSRYTGAMYQRDVMNALARQSEVVFYGPNIPGFDGKKSVSSVLREVGSVDAVIVGHSWLNGEPNAHNWHDATRLEDVPVPKFFILNKEYAFLDEKLTWARNRGFVRGFSHHHDVESFEQGAGFPFSFWPFGFDDKLFSSGQTLEKNIDFSFSGILRNETPGNGQSDSRLRVTKKLFHCVGDIPLARKKNYRHLNIVWNSIPRGSAQKKIAKSLGRYRYLEPKEYRDLQLKSKVYLNTLSPMGLVGPRFFENMATRALVLTEKSHHVSRIFPADCFVTFRPDLSDFDLKLSSLLENEEARISVTHKAYEEVMKNHTWDARVRFLLDQIRLALSG